MIYVYVILIVIFLGSVFFIEKCRKPDYENEDIQSSPIDYDVRKFGIWYINSGKHAQAKRKRKMKK